MISPEVGRIDPDHVVGVHVTQLFSFPSGDPAELTDFTPEGQGQLATLQWFYENKFSFNTLMAQQPQTLAFALMDSPVGLLAWNAQLLGEGLDADFALTNVMLYWLTGTAASAARLYYENAQTTPPAEPTQAPLGLAAFGGDFSGIRRFAERDHANIVHWSVFDHGGAFRGPQSPRSAGRRRAPILQSTPVRSGSRRAPHRTVTWPRATTSPARQPGARPPGGAWIDSASRLQLAISHEITEFEFHISPAPSSSRPQTAVGTWGARSSTRCARSGSSVSRCGLSTAS
jgi:hypothetical protein